MRLRTKVTATVIAVAALTGGAVAANAVTEPREGGTFSYGAHDSNRGTYSDYYHASRPHNSTAGSATSYLTSPWTSAGSWSRASVPSSLFGNWSKYSL